MILRELMAMHEEWQSMADGMERDGVATAYPHDYQKAKQRAEFYLTAASNFQRLTGAGIASTPEPA